MAAARKAAPSPPPMTDTRCLVERLKAVADYLATQPHHELRGGADLLRVIRGSGPVRESFDRIVTAENAWLLYTLRDCVRGMLLPHADQIAKAADALKGFPVLSVALICPCPAHAAQSRAAWNVVGPMIVRKAKRAGLLKGGKR